MKKIVDGVLHDLTPEEQMEHEAAHAATMVKQAKTVYAKNRVTEYPSIGDQLDALWKGGDAAAAMLAQVQAVKTKYPKPE